MAPGPSPTMSGSRRNQLAACLLGGLNGDSGCLTMKAEATQLSFRGQVYSLLGGPWTPAEVETLATSVPSSVKVGHTQRSLLL